MSSRVLADDIEKVANVLADGPLSVRDVADKVGFPGWLADETLGVMRQAGQVGMQQERVRGKGKVNLFFLKLAKGT